jgi:polysaccharide pyruvyl transferase WcaK-like protein
MSETKFLLVGNGPYLNKGCEAIVRGTSHILKESFGECIFYSANFDLEDPPYIPVETDDRIIHKPISQARKWSYKWFMHKILIQFVPNMAWGYFFRNIASEVKSVNFVLSIGGDNYTLDYSFPKLYVALDEYVYRNGKPLVIWGASVGPFDSDPVVSGIMHEHLRSKVKAIFVREERSYQYLKKYGVSKNLHLVPDPAFVMEPEPCGKDETGFDLPDGVIGINLSPQIVKMLPDELQDTYVSQSVAMIERVRDKSGLPVALVTHVTSPHSNDYELLEDIYKKSDQKDIYLLPANLNAAQTKYIISKMSCLAAARTHATIAGFSTCVPTVSLAYSVKAHGINEMLFGHQEFVVSLDHHCAEEIESKIIFVLEKSDDIKRVLSGCMCKIKEDAMTAGRLLKDLQ